MSNSPIVSHYFTSNDTSESFIPDTFEHPPKKQRTEQNIPDIPIVVHPGHSLAPVIEEDADELESEEKKVYVALAIHQNKLGVACFDSSTQQIHITEIFEDFEFENVRQIKYQFKPCVIITHAVSLNQYENYQKALVNAEDGRKCEVKFALRSDFHFESAKNKIIMLHLPSFTTDMKPSDKARILSSEIDFSKEQMVRALGGLIHFLLSEKIVNQLEDSGSPIHIQSINNFTIDGCLSVDVNTLESLQIFSNEDHPTKGKGKEGLSLFGILNKCKSIGGKKLLRLWFMRPSNDTAVIRDRLDTVSYFLQSENLSIIPELQNCLKNIKELDKILLRIKNVRASINDWKNLYQTILLSLKIKQLFSMRNSNLELQIFKKIDDVLGHEIIRVLANSLGQIIDYDASKENCRLIIKPGVVEGALFIIINVTELDELKRTYEGLGDFLTTVAKEEMRNLPLFLASEMHIVYFPQLGCLMALPFNEEFSLEQQIRVDGLEYQFHTSSRIYFKNKRCRELDNYLGDIHNDIVDIEASVSHKLEEKILSHTECLTKITNVASELDCLLSFAVSAKEYNYKRPNLTHENVIYITKGRNPLSELCVEQFIDNDTAMCYNREGVVQYITGPNGSGKSIYLKQVGLIVFMAHIGSFVPADSAMIGLTDRIFSRISSRDSVSANQSTFMIDCCQLTTMLKCSTSRSLLLIDEFGKGTAPLDGVCLLASTVKFLLSKNQDAPKTIIATHFNEIFDHHLLEKDRNLQLLTMQFTVTVSGEDLSTLSFFYRLAPGIASLSHGSYSARLSGIPEDILKRSEIIANCIVNKKPIEPLETSKQKKYKKIAQEFLKLDLEKEDISKFIRDLPSDEREE